MKTAGDMKPIQKDRDPSASRGCCRWRRVWFTKDTERRVFFALTLMMLIAGILYRTGVW